MGSVFSLPAWFLFSCGTTRSSDFQQLASNDKKLNPNQWEVHLIDAKLCEDTRPDPQFQKAKAQHSMLISNLHRQGYREAKLHVILVGIMGTIVVGVLHRSRGDSKHPTMRLKQIES